MREKPDATPKVIVTGAGGPAGVAVIRALQAAAFPVVGADASASAVGARLADEGAVVPRADDVRLAGCLLRLAATTGATVLISTVAEEMVGLEAASDELAAAGVRTWLPSSDTVELCIDKWQFARAMQQAGVPTPMTAMGENDGVPGPWIVKPRRGRGSRDVVAVDDPSDLTWALRRVPDPIVQTRLCGDEFTVDLLVDRDGTLAGAVPRWRLETKAGISTRGRTFRHEGVIAGVARLVDAIGLRGPANVQGFVAPDGAVTFVEVNPRFSGGLPLSLAAGADLVGEYVRGILGYPVRPQRLVFREGVTMVRYYEELFEG